MEREEVFYGSVAQFGTTVSLFAWRQKHNRPDWILTTHPDASSGLPDDINYLDVFITSTSPKVTGQIIASPLPTIRHTPNGPIARTQLLITTNDTAWSVIAPIWALVRNHLASQGWFDAPPIRQLLPTLHHPHSTRQVSEGLFLHTFRAPRVDPVTEAKQAYARARANALDRPIQHELTFKGSPGTCVSTVAYMIRQCPGYYTQSVDVDQSNIPAYASFWHESRTQDGSDLRGWIVARPLPNDTTHLSIRALDTTWSQLASCWRVVQATLEEEGWIVTLQDVQESNISPPITPIRKKMKRSHAPTKRKIQSLAKYRAECMRENPNKMWPLTGKQSACKEHELDPETVKRHAPNLYAHWNDPSYEWRDEDYVE